MRRRSSLALTAAVLALAISAPAALAPIAFAQDAAAQAPANWSQEDTMRIVQDIQKKLRNLSTYGVFDWITFGIRGKVVTLEGYASRPVLKSDAERAIKGIKGIESVDNQIVVLPNSPNDDRIRAEVYNRIYTAAQLRKYNANAGNLARAIGPGGRTMTMAGGITNNPPLGFNGIHIIVNNGNVTLYGVVLNSGDKTVAGMQANSAPGAFRVDNDLIVQQSAKSSSK